MTTQAERLLDIDASQQLDVDEVRREVDKALAQADGWGLTTRDALTISLAASVAHMTQHADDVTKKYNAAKGAQLQLGRATKKIEALTAEVETLKAQLLNQTEISKKNFEAALDLKERLDL